MSDDPERLLAEALRAQARYAPAPPTTPPAQPAQPTPSARSSTPAGRPANAVDLPGGYGLLSGNEDAALDSHPTKPVMEPRPKGSHRLESEPLAAPWVLLLAASLGMAVGSVIGLLTVL
ncbi:hypothetical protein [Saccharomonospora glauca]|jgi:hypothetical protein|uniref:Uncharacterized protein n=1 Tax=Saccharomonospora glauca K62 TaxID=928724 RepID=I1D7Z7_9PSEU|nr:hypothetical protein [Saccharomonospora glauca]EIF01072.1 hypothetical protein SacglDRAFT_04241 [Saccharomonospora glauca K62]